MSTFYKFLPPKRIKYLKDELLRFTPPSDLNDPFECLPSFPDELAAEEAFVEELKNNPLALMELSKFNFDSPGFDEKVESIKLKFGLGKKTVEEARKNYYQRVLKNANKHFGIFSLSKTWNLSLMWAHYASSHQGFCIGYDAKDKFFEFGPFVDRVNYAIDRTVAKTDLTEDEIRGIFFRKSIEWSYEKEVRVVAKLKDAHTITKCEPYNIAKFKVPHKSISEIIIGINTEQPLIKEISAFGKKHGVTIYQAKLSQRGFNLERKKIYTPL